MAKSKTLTFVTELPLIVDSLQEKQLLSRFQAARQLYNACLNSGMARMNLVRNCEAYQLAKQIDRQSKKARLATPSPPQGELIDIPIMTFKLMQQ
ncbi:hypothetical protein [Microseira wollei]|uniref:Transposase, IS605 family protein n=1 Tax=Microseira wollei NIES-4236 TaxID=2530354 RepID=A0AAV3XUP4_9CYAN|nr:hypothetical protein [Microseira wollei]GET44562.1 transposase, IS605 family protein [Microseira wollei NIES-4236]